MQKPQKRCRCTIYFASMMKILTALIVLSFLGETSIFAQGILIFSTTHSNTESSELTEAQGILKVTVSTFTPILELKVNEKIQTPQYETKTQLEIPYTLEKGKNEFEIYVKTEAAEASKEFELNLLDADELAQKKKGGKKSYKIDTMVYIQSTDNAQKTSDDKEAGQKLGILATPYYWLQLGKKSNIEINGVFLREKFSDSDMADEETIYTKIGVGWLNQAGFGEWRLDVGYTDNGIEMSGLSYETDIETTMFLGAQIKLKALDNKKVSLDIKYVIRNQPDPLTSDYDGDGALLTLGGKWDKDISNITGYLKGYYQQNDAKGVYMDYNAMKLELYGVYPLNKKLNIGGLVSVKQTSYKESDPLKGDKEASTLSIFTILGDYTLTGLWGTKVFGGIMQKQKSSNIESLKYSTMIITLGGLYVF